MEKIIDMVIADVQLIVEVKKQSFYTNYVFELKNPNSTDSFRFQFISSMSPHEKKEVVMDWILEDVISYWEEPQDVNEYFQSYSIDRDLIVTDEAKREHEKIMEKQRALKQVVTQDWIDSVKSWRKLIEI